jgi:hypothetical protein
MSIDAFAQQSTIRLLVVRFCTLVLMNEETFREKPEVVADYFCRKYEACRGEIDRICEKLQQLIDVNGVSGIENFRDQVKEELRRPVFLNNPNGQN